MISRYGPSPWMPRLRYTVFAAIVVVRISGMGALYVERYYSLWPHEI